MMTRSASAPFSGRQLLLALAGILLATVVVPPAAAWRLNRYRIDQTAERATHAAARLQSDRARLDAFPPGVAVACGPGRLPSPESGAPQSEWVRRAVAAPELFGAGTPTDGWGRCFLMNIGEWASGGRVWLLSAGPNGLIDTPLGASTIAGDDIGAVVR